ncbi:MAG: 50S ribosomal protein L6, partial [Candidatus Aminicenantes bacterium RBG_13_62_12]
MSRVGKQAIVVPPGVKVDILPGKLAFAGPKGKLDTPLSPGISARLEEGRLVLSRENDSPSLRAAHGLARSLAWNAAVGVSTGFSKQLEIVGVGYR